METPIERWDIAIIPNSLDLYCVNGSFGCVDCSAVRVACALGGSIKRCVHDSITRLFLTHIGNLTLPLEILSATILMVRHY